MASRQRKDNQVTHAFTVKWIWAWAIMHGHKTADFGNGFGEPQLRNCRLFFRAFPTEAEIRYT